LSSAETRAGDQARHQLRCNDLRGPVAARDPGTCTSTGTSAAQALCRHEMTLAPVRKGQRTLNVVEHLELLDLTQASAPGAGTAGICLKTPAIDANRDTDV